MSYVRAAAAAAAAAVLALVLVGCSEPQGSGTNTNWLRQCLVTEDCDPTDACLCGRCTLECQSDADCPQETVCTPSEAAALQCSGGATATCQPGCTTSDDCQTGRLCHHGACVDALPPLDCSGDFLFCDDFEAPLSSEYISVVTEGNSVERALGSAPSGTAFLLSSVTAAPSAAYLRADIAAGAAESLFLSAWVKVPSDPAHDVAPLSLWTSTQESWALRLTVRDAGVEVWSETTPMTGSHPLQPGSWHCLQLAVTVGDAPDGAVQLFIDGATVETATGVDTLPDGGIEAVAWGDLWAGTASEVEIDRVVVATSAVGCYD